MPRTCLWGVYPNQPATHIADEFTITGSYPTAAFDTAAKRRNSPSMRGNGSDGSNDLPGRIIKAVAALAIGGILLAFRNDVHETWLRAVLAVLAFLGLAFPLLQLRGKKK